MTVYLFKTQILRKLLVENAAQESHEFGRDIFPAMIEGFRVYGYKFQGYWGYSRTLEEYWSTNMEFLGDPPKIDLTTWKVRTNLDHESITDRGPAFVGPEGRVADVRMHNGVRVEGDVSRSILFPGAHVEAGAVVRDSILFYDTQVGPGARLDRVITDIGVSVGREARVGRSGGMLSVIGTETQIPRGMDIGPGCSVHPGVQPDDFVATSYDEGAVIQCRW
jgi:glucose-1-phosphate adenylyltransferase